MPAGDKLFLPLGGGGDPNHGHGHVHGLHHTHHSSVETQYNENAKPLPPIGSEEHTSTTQFWHKGAEDGTANRPRSTFERFTDVMHMNVFDTNPGSMSLDKNMGGIGKTRTFFSMVGGPLFPLLPETYTDKYIKPAVCAEVYRGDDHRFDTVKDKNPKIPPPIDGKYNDYYHMLAFKRWFEKERSVYWAETQRLYLTINRCALKEKMEGTVLKNCRHLWNKWFSMTRAEEMSQALLYMALTGNVAIRETPYPEDFVDQKRKIYDDWLFRTRHRRPNDDVLTRV